MDEEGALGEFHNKQLESYLKFARFKREQHLRDVQAAFADTKESRLYDEHYTKQEVIDILDSLASVVKGDVQKELLHVSHTTTLLLRQMFAQAETILFELHADTNQLENERLIKEIASFEEQSIEKEKNPKLAMKPLSKPSDKALQHTVGVLSEQNKGFQEKFKILQQKAIEIANEKTKVGEDLEKSRQIIEQLKKQLEKLGEKPEVNVALVEKKAEAKADAKVETVQKQLDAVKIDNSKEIETLKQDLQKAKDEQAKAKEELDKKLNASAPFLNMRKMISKKNDQIKTLREGLRKYDPAAADAIKVDENE